MHGLAAPVREPVVGCHNTGDLLRRRNVAKAGLDMRHDLTSLKIFIAVAECANLTRAAEREHLALSAVSKRVAELEESLHTPLLQRHARGVSLTPAGQSVLRYARQVLQLVREMDVELGEYASGIKGHVRLHAVASALTQFLPRDVETFLATYPLVHISMEERTGKDVALAVANGNADLGVISGVTPRAGLLAYRYHSDELSIGAPLGHPLARRKSVRFEEALNYPFIGPHIESSLSALMAEGAKSADRALQQRVRASSFDVMCRLVESRLGITMLPDGVLAAYATSGRLKIVRLNEKWARRQLFLVVRDGEQLSPIAKTLLEHLQRAAMAPERHPRTSR